MTADLSLDMGGYRMPAEWELHEATWLSWPHNRDTWPGKFETVEPAMVRLVEALAPSEPVYINVESQEEASRVGRLLAGVGGVVRFFHFRTNDAWCRDHGAIFVLNAAAPAPPRVALNWQYNAWGGKYPPFEKDNAIPEQMAAALGVPCCEVPLVLEGGSIDSNGAGTLITTTSCLLNPNRNPGWTKAALEQRLRDHLGVLQIIWLEGYLAGDDTDGHIDNLVRFVSPDTVVAVSVDDPSDPHHQPFEANKAILTGVRLPSGEALKVLDLPLPPPQYYGAHRLPASYANFYIANDRVLMPAYERQADELAAAVLASVFPDRIVVPVDCRDLIWGLGAIHCLTQQVPLPTIS